MTQPREPVHAAFTFDDLVSDLVHDLLQILTRETRGLGITVAQAYLLRQLNRHGRLSAAMIGDSLGITSGPVTSITRRLVRSGLIEDHRDDEDRRVVWFTLTESGRTTLRRLTEDTRAFWARLFEEMGQGSGEASIASLKIFAQSVRRLEQHLPPGSKGPSV